ncbi:MAG: hypothetical protein OIF58_02915 [Cohaesibacter sp.]|nr:hypothetical protein [Cohaesibacter sp.]
MKAGDHVFPILGAIFVIVAGISYNYIFKEIDLSKITTIILICAAVYAFFLYLYNVIIMKPRDLHDKFADLHDRINLTVETLIRKQQFIEQKTLGLIEENAEDIWVITTSLENELTDPDLAKTVSDNVSRGKKYKYFLPHPNHPYFKNVDRNIENYKKLYFYEKYKGNIQFIRMPLHVHFLLEEVVIYNPYQPERSAEDFSGINGFTYYRNNDQHNEKSLHMRIEGQFLKFLAEQLDNYLRDTGLKNTAEEILIDFGTNLNGHQKAFLATLIGKKSILKDGEYEDFKASLEEIEPSVCRTIIQMLSNYENDYVDGI